MGISPFRGSSSSYDKKNNRERIVVEVNTKDDQKSKKLPNPNPSNFRIIKSEEIGMVLVVMVLYPDCTTFEGKKILVYRCTTLNDLLSQGHLDPHFSDSDIWRSPIARFRPTKEGWEHAIKFANMIWKEYR